MDRCISKKEEEVLYPPLGKNIIKTKTDERAADDGRSNRGTLVQTVELFATVLSHLFTTDLYQ